MIKSCLRSLRSSILVILAILVGWQCAKQNDNPASPAGNQSEKGPSLSKSGSTVSTHLQSSYPDLTIDSTRLARSIQIVSRNFKQSDCAVVEGCASPGKRRLLRYDVSIPNFGGADLIVGSPTDPSNSGLFEWSPCHGHYHYKDFSEYRLKDLSGTVLISRKQAFCLMDILRYWQGYTSGGYNCSNQGISRGWADLYDKTLDCQWIDITGVPAGNYYIEVEVNKGGVFSEGANVYPNIVRVPVTIKPGG